MSYKHVPQSPLIEFKSTDDGVGSNLTVLPLQSFSGDVGPILHVTLPDQSERGTIKGGSGTPVSCTYRGVSSHGTLKLNCLSHE